MKKSQKESSNSEKKTLLKKDHTQLLLVVLCIMLFFSLIQGVNFYTQIQNTQNLLDAKALELSTCSEGLRNCEKKIASSFYESTYLDTSDWERRTFTVENSWTAVRPIDVALPSGVEIVNDGSSATISVGGKDLIEIGIVIDIVNAIKVDSIDNIIFTKNGPIYRITSGGDDDISYVSDVRFDDRCWAPYEDSEPPCTTGMFGVSKEGEQNNYLVSFVGEEKDLATADKIMSSMVISDTE